MKTQLANLFKNAFLQNSFVLFLGTMAGNVLNYLFHLLVGRMVDPVTYGEVESLISLLTIVSVPAATLTLIATRYAAGLKSEQNGIGLKKLSSYFNQKIIKYGLPSIVLAIVISPFLQDFLKIPDRMSIYLLWLVMFFSFLSAATVGLLTGWQRFGDVNRVGIAGTVLKLLAACIFLWFGFGANGVILALALSACFGYSISIFLLRRLFVIHSSTERNSLSEAEISIGEYAKPAFFTALSMAVLGNVDMVFAKHHLDPFVSGEYGALSVVSKTIFFATGLITTVLFAMSAERSYQKTNSLSTFYVASVLIFFVCLSAILLFWLFPELAMSIFFGEKYLAASSKLVWFALAASLYSMGVLFLQYLMSIQKTQAALTFLALSSLEILALFFWGESFYAIITITLTAQLLSVLCGLWFVLKVKDDVSDNHFYSHTSI